MTNSPDLTSYDKILVAFSGGKDSLAALLAVIEALIAAGVPQSEITNRVELHHHDVDGASKAFMDWACTTAYCRAVAASFGLPLYMSYKDGGFEREMNRDGTATAPILFETPEGLRSAGGKGPEGTRGKFPQVSPDLSVRWCSAYLKIDVMAASVRNQDRFLGRRTLVVTGERAQESASRAKYQTFEKHRTDTRDGTRKARHVDHWRPIHGWKEEAVWEIIQRNGVVPHVAYQLGWGRLSCMTCIFGSADQWATIATVFPARFEIMAQREEATGATIQRKHSIRELAARGTPYAAALSQPELVAQANAEHYYLPVRVAPEAWTLPAGAYGESAGPV